MDAMQDHMYGDLYGNLIVRGAPEEVPYYQSSYRGYKVEYYDGHIYLMAPPTSRHNIVTGNMFSMLDNILSDCKKCRVFGDNEGYFGYEGYTMPDVSVQCLNENGERELTVAVEVLSPYNLVRGKRYAPLFLQKLDRYKKYNVRAIVIVDIDRKTIDVLEHPDYQETVYSMDDSFEILGGTIRVADIINSEDLAFANAARNF